MEKKINLVKLLKDCPKGRELDCTMYDNVKFDYILEGNAFPIKVDSPTGQISLDKYGCYSNNKYAKCVIFPKGKDSWEGFKCPFKDGDIVATNTGNWIAITEGGERGKCIPVYCVFKYNSEFEAYCKTKKEFAFNRLATEEEKEKLFQIIK